jgi:uncharacterized membrane protein YkgB
VMVLIFIPFGRHKFVPQYEHGISIYISNSPIVSWLSIFGERWASNIIGTIELTTAFLLIVGYLIPVLSLNHPLIFPPGCAHLANARCECN